MVYSSLQGAAATDQFGSSTHQTLPSYCATIAHRHLEWFWIVSKSMVTPVKLQMSSSNADCPAFEAFGGPADLDKYITVLHILLTRLRLQTANDYILKCKVYDQIAKLCLRKWHLTKDQTDQEMVKQALCNSENHAKVMINLAGDLSDRFERRELEDGEKESINGAVRLGYEAIRVLGKNPAALNDFSTIVLTRYEAPDKLWDLELATDLAK